MIPLSSDRGSKNSIGIGANGFAQRWHKWNLTTLCKVRLQFFMTFYDTLQDAICIQLFIICLRTWGSSQGSKGTSEATSATDAWADPLFLCVFGVVSVDGFRLWLTCCGHVWTSPWPNFCWDSPTWHGCLRIAIPAKSKLLDFQVRLIVRLPPLEWARSGKLVIQLEFVKPKSSDKSLWCVP